MKKNYIFSAFVAIFALASCEKDENNTINTRTPHAVEFQQRTLSLTPGAALPEGAEAVDLGLSVKWANMNLGASSESEAGDLYAWGEVTPSGSYSWRNYEMNDFHPEDPRTLYITRYCFDRYGASQDLSRGGVNLERNDDAAYVQWGGDWRMPTYAEVQELVEKCTFSYDEETALVTVTGPSGSSIRIPKSSLVVGIAEGVYGEPQGAVTPGFWTATLDTCSSFDGVPYPQYLGVVQEKGDYF